jgi:hypothetical protein
LINFYDSFSATPLDVEQVHTGAMETARPHIWQETLAYPISQGNSRDEADVEEAHQSEETTAILDERERLAEAESELWKR